MRDGDLSLRELPAFARDVVKDAAEGLNRAVPRSSRNVLRQVVDGLTDAAAATASSVRSMVASTGERGGHLLRRDAGRLVQDLRELEGSFLNALQRAGRSLRGAARDEMDSIVRQARRAGTRIGPAAERAIRAMDGRFTELGMEAARAGVRATRSAVGSTLRGASGLLEALGKVASGTGRRER